MTLKVSKMKKKTTQAFKKVSARQVVTYQPPSDPTLALIERAARDPDIDVSKMRELLQMKKDHEEDLRKQGAEEARRSYQSDMIAAQTEMEPVTRTAYNTHTKSKYAKLEHISAGIKPVYSKHGFALSYTSPKRLEDGTMLIGVWCMHRGGHKEYHELPCKVETTGIKGSSNMTGLQGLGNLISYLRRYLTCMIFDVILIDEDNDGNSDTPEKSSDGFAERVREEPPVKPEPEEDWKPEHGISIGAKRQSIDYQGDKLPELQALNYLSAVMEKRKHKQSRIDLINENLPLIRSLIKSGNGDQVKTLHAIADKGA